MQGICFRRNWPKHFDHPTHHPSRQSRLAGGLYDTPEGCTAARRAASSHWMKYFMEARTAARRAASLHQK